MIISHAHRFIFLKPQKTAGTSVELALSEVCGPLDVITDLSREDKGLGRGKQVQNMDVPRANMTMVARLMTRLGRDPRRSGTRYHQHMNAANVRRTLDPGVFDSYTKVSMVRNAWDREVSLYYWATRREPQRPSFDSFVRRRVFHPERKTFEIYTIKGTPIADVMLRYETLDRDFRAFVETLGLAEPLLLPHAKAGFRESAPRDYQGYYSAETRDIVRKRNAREIALFNMTFD